jgi:hypothetical protein
LEVETLTICSQYIKFVYLLVSVNLLAIFILPSYGEKVTVWNVDVCIDRVPHCPDVHSLRKKSIVTKLITLQISD